MRQVESNELIDRYAHIDLGASEFATRERPTRWLHLGVLRQGGSQQSVGDEIKMSIRIEVECLMLPLLFCAQQ